MKEGDTACGDCDGGINVINRSCDVVAVSCDDVMWPKK